MTFNLWIIAYLWPHSFQSIFFHFRPKTQRAVSSVLLWWCYCYSFLWTWAAKRCCEVFTEEVSVLLSVNSILDRCVCPCVCVCVRVSKPPVSLTSPALQLREALLRSHANSHEFVCVLWYSKRSKPWMTFILPLRVATSLHFSPPPAFFALVSLSNIYFLDSFTTFLTKSLETYIPTHKIQQKRW